MCTDVALKASYGLRYCLIRQTTYVFCRNFWMNIPSVFWSESTMLVPSRCSRFDSPYVARLVSFCVICSFLIEKTKMIENLYGMVFLHYSTFLIVCMAADDLYCRQSQITFFVKTPFLLLSGNNLIV